MWLCFNDGFVSAVEDRYDPDGLIIRARRKAHLEALFPDEFIHVTPKADYRYRVFISKRRFAEIVAEKIRSIDYYNFKNSVVEDELHDLYETWWFDHFQYQKGEK